ncbi:helix-hairpin-helix domain-containing protein [Thalassomonas haliotis]|uniref:Helix-hairpin-helix domain-containing protein n=1 Tax=Thalassomonas haliotis TaxID=485448 RepID=A0ABY7VAN2_9GAMM|nr:helix-hairpin-helix domain-containing protein [Thalassomonas haliotis]WDE10633.1 helix-hairpin-helix domain-containing protein [Thalassomonas haliotis]
MGFSKEEKSKLLELKGVGPTVIKRFEEIGINSLNELKKYRADDIAEMVASMLHTTCWKNSPQAKSAINAAIDLAKQS